MQHLVRNNIRNTNVIFEDTFKLIVISVKYKYHTKMSRLQHLTQASLKSDSDIKRSGWKQHL